MNARPAAALTRTRMRSSACEVLSTDNRAKVASVLQRLEATGDTAKQLAGELRVVLGKVDGMVTDNRGHIDQTMAALAQDLQVVGEPHRRDRRQHGRHEPEPERCATGAWGETADGR